ncbi:hypothetical protein CEV08_01150 [Bartonella tribocorum]|uniref:Uncharacterized protein n=1 Tax=Bartonella tribocorum TaxID=85701 RepID=A0A2M6UXE7_9HYPH|nr:hypothetical protein CEV08_01150 [Bartonella tribocorum]
MLWRKNLRILLFIFVDLFLKFLNILNEYIFWFIKIIPYGGIKIKNSFHLECAFKIWLYGFQKHLRAIFLMKYYILL